MASPKAPCGAVHFAAFAVARSGRGDLRRRAIIDPRVIVFNAKFARPGENLGAAILKHRA
jgi:hypothetical protein